MANSAGMCTSFKGELLTGIHALGPGTGVPARTVSTADVVKAALFLASASRGVADTVYNTTGELAASGNYTQGGVTVTMATAPSTSGTTGIFTPSASFTWAALTSSGAFDACVLYNSSQSDKQISVHTFSSQSITAGTFTLTMPTNDASNALLRIA
ncbi:MAG: hypothetical protein IPM06_21525 [Rhizobiales bacterium]|nr:hypothetical protein [Hyphomicrobiales bacterium]